MVLVAAGAADVLLTPDVLLALALDVPDGSGSSAFEFELFSPVFESSPELVEPWVVEPVPLPPFVVPAPPDVFTPDTAVVML